MLLVLWMVVMPFLCMWVGITMVSGDPNLMTRDLLWKLQRPLLERQARRRYRGRPSAGTGYPAWKWALIALHWEKDRPLFASFRPLRDDSVVGVGYSAEDTAVCAAGESHPVPSAHRGGPGCGFYALKLARHLGRVPGSHKGQNRYHRHCVALLEVELHGTVHVGSLGFRAEKQRVLSASFSPRCAHPAREGRHRRWRRFGQWSNWRRCRHPAIGFNGLNHVGGGILTIPTVAGPTCERHRRGDLLSLTDLANLLGCEVHWAPRRRRWGRVRT